MNHHANQSISPLTLLRSIASHRSLIFSMSKREIVGRYRGSVMGLLWSFFNPIFMLSVYTFVFSEVFKVKWAGGANSKTEFALVLFAGLMPFNVFSECISRAPTLILSNVSYVKKVVFPLEILPLIILGSSLFHFLISLLVWLIFCIIFSGIPPLTALLLPVILLPLFFYLIGLSWFISSVGVYLRDVEQVITVFIAVLMYLTPIFYPASALPKQYQEIIQLNPLTNIVEQIRTIMYWGGNLEWKVWTTQTMISIIVAWLGFAWFQKTRKGFADVL